MRITAGIMRRVAAALGAALCTAFFASCASAPYVQREDKVLTLVSLINEGRVGEVEGLTPAPFVLDTETLYLESDVSTLWKNLKEASFALKNARYVSAEHVGPESWRLFAGTYDMKNFFARYTGKDTSVVTLETADGTYLLLLERAVKGYPRIRGMKGPVR